MEHLRSSERNCLFKDAVVAASDVTEFPGSISLVFPLLVFDNLTKEGDAISTDRNPLINNNNNKMSVFNPVLFYFYFVI